MMGAASGTKAASANAGAQSSVWCSAAALGAGGVQARENLSLNALLNMQKESQDALNDLGGALVDVDESRDSPIGESQDSPHNTTHMHYHYRIF